MTVLSDPSTTDPSTTAPFAWDGHILLLHGSESERQARFAAWVRRGLENDEKVVCTEAHGEPPERSILRTLQRHGIDVSAATAQGRLALLPLPEFYPPAGHTEMIDRALAEGHRALRISAAANAALTIMPEHVYSGIERAIDQLCLTHRFSAMCQYEEAGTVGDRLQDVAHSHVGGGIRQHGLSTGRNDGRVVLAGEIDMSNDEMLTCALRAAADRTSGTLRLDLNLVEFFGAAGCRALDEGTSEFRRQGGRVLLIGPAPPVEHILRLAGIDRLERVELIGSLR
jgi:anti-anti-sigma factor